MNLPIYLSDPAGRQGRSQSTHDYITRHMHNTVRKALKRAGFNTSRKAAPDMLKTENPLEGFGGLIVFGGPDVDARFYEKGRFPRKGNARDAYELDLIFAAIKAGIPVLGICRGMQLINIAFGGTLHADIKHLTEHKHNNFGSGAYENNAIAHDVSVSGSSILTEGAYSVASSHHQAVDQIGEGLMVTAKSHDGLIEMIEAADLNVIGTQWHPEASHVVQDDTLSPLLDWFMGAVQNSQGVRTEGLLNIMSAQGLADRFPTLRPKFSTYKTRKRERGGTGYSIYQGQNRTHVPAWQWEDAEDTSPSAMSLREFRNRKNRPTVESLAPRFADYLDETDDDLLDDFTSEAWLEDEADWEAALRGEQRQAGRHSDSENEALLERLKAERREFDAALRAERERETWLY